MEWIETLHPAAQVAAIVGVAAFACIFVWQFWKTIRET